MAEVFEQDFFHQQYLGGCVTFSQFCLSLGMILDILFPDLEIPILKKKTLPSEVHFKKYTPKDDWSLQWKGLNLYSRDLQGLGPQNT